MSALSCFNRSLTHVSGTVSEQGPVLGGCRGQPWTTNIPPLPQEAHSLVVRRQKKKQALCFPTVFTLRYYTRLLGEYGEDFLHSSEPPV